MDKRARREGVGHRGRIGATGFAGGGLSIGGDRRKPVLDPGRIGGYRGAYNGKVSVTSTEVAGMPGHLVLPVTHTFIMQSPVLIAQALLYLDPEAGP